MSMATDHRRKVIRALKAAADGAEFITAAALGRAVGDSNCSRVRQTYLSNLTCVNGRLYLITEVADELIKKETLK